MHPAALLLGLACGGALVCAIRRGCIIATLFAWSMVSVWAAANLAWQGLALAYMPWVELPVAAAAYAVWETYGERWQGWFSWITGARMFLWTMYPGVGMPGEAAFLHVLNATFLAALVAISWKGGADAIGDCLSGLRRLRVLVAAHQKSLV